jgi:hypothetical protein
MRNLVIRLKQTVGKLKAWMNRRDRNDDDWFDHPFAIL